jgi:hypothetical protein
VQVFEVNVAGGVRVRGVQGPDDLAGLRAGRLGQLARRGRAEDDEVAPALGGSAYGIGFGVDLAELRGAPGADPLGSVLLRREGRRTWQAFATALGVPRVRRERAAGRYRAYAWAQSQDHARQSVVLAALCRA